MAAEEDQTHAPCSCALCLAWLAAVANAVRNRAARPKEPAQAEAVDEGQKAGEIATPQAGRPISVRESDTSAPATLPDLGISRQRPLSHET